MRDRRLAASGYRATLVIAAVATLVSSVGPAGAYQRPGSVERVSVTASGGQSSGETDLFSAAMTPDGRYVAFASTATDLVPGATPALSGTVTSRTQVYVRDRLKGTTRVASIGWNGAPAASLTPTCGGAGYPAITPDGRYVVFESCDDNLVPGPKGAPRGGDNNLATDIFLRDMARGTTERISVAPGGGDADNESRQPTISSDGRFVAFLSNAANLGPDVCPSDTAHQTVCRVGMTNGHLYVAPPAQAYVRDRLKKSTQIVSVSNAGSAADGGVYDAAISANGRYVAFDSAGDNLRDEDLNACPLTDRPGCPDTFVRDLVTKKTEIISVGLDGRSGLDQSGRTLLHQVQSISADGRYVAFRSSARGLVPNDLVTAYSGSFYVRDRVLRRTERVSVDSSGVPLSANSYPHLSVDGRYVMYATSVPCAPASPIAVGVHDRLTGATVAFGRVNDRGKAIACDPYFNEFPESISANGRYLAFVSNGGGIVHDDSNGRNDAFVVDRGPALGLGRLGSSDSLKQMSGADAGPGLPALVEAGTDLIAADVVERPWSRDLFVRWQVSQMPLFALADPTVVYCVDLTVHGRSYQVRVAKAGVDASFGLFQRSAGGWSRVASLTGGYGTSGQEVVAAVPLADLGLTVGEHLETAKAFTARGSFLLGGLQVMDSLRLTAAGAM